MDIRQSHSVKLGMIISLGIIVKLGLFLVLHGLGADFTLPDLPTYMNPAIALLHHKPFIHSPALWERTPIYPLFLATMFRLFGIHYEPVIIFQILLSSLLVWNAYRITSIFANSKIALYAAAVVAFDYLIISYANQIMSDLIFAVLFSFIFYEGLLLIKLELTYKRIFRLGIMLGVCTLIRPLSYYLIPIGAIVLLMYTQRCIGIRQSIICFFVFLVPSIFLVGSWQYRNKQVVGSYWLTSVDALNLYHYYGADILAHLQHKPIAEIQQQLYERAQKYQFHSSAALFAYYRHEGMQVLMAHPLLAVEQGVTGFFRLWFGNDYTLLYYNENEFNHGKQLEQHLYNMKWRQFFREASVTDLGKMIAISLFFAVNGLFVFGFLGYMFYVWYSNRQHIKFTYFILLIIGYYCLVSSNYCSLARFRLPFQIIIDSCGTIGLYQFLMWQKAKYSDLRAAFLAKDNILTS